MRPITNGYSSQTKPQDVSFLGCMTLDLAFLKFEGHRCVKQGEWNQAEPLICLINEGAQRGLFFGVLSWASRLGEIPHRIHFWGNLGLLGFRTCSI